ncbi:MAG: mechanosensitive ion channel [Prevotella sp.]|nr:mechanosensitive ion channel [Prevotella sp.]
MEVVKLFVENILSHAGLADKMVPIFGHIALVLVAVFLAWMAGFLCRKILVPLVLKLVARTAVRWDDIVFDRSLLNLACNIVAAMVIWQLLPLVFYDFPVVKEVLARLTAIYLTVTFVLLITGLINRLQRVDVRASSSTKQYLQSFCGIIKIFVIFIAVIVVVSIAINKDPSVLFAGLGATSAILMLVFQDTIKGLVAGVRLASNDMLHVGDWITVPAAGANGRVEEITLTTVKIRNFDNTIVTVTPQTLVDGSFQNWLGMEQSVGRKVVRKVYFDFCSIKKDEDGSINLTRYRNEMERWLSQHPAVDNTLSILVHQLEATPTGLPVEFVFWLKDKDSITYEHNVSEMLEYVYAKADEYELKIYQR